MKNPLRLPGIEPRSLGPPASDIKVHGLVCPAVLWLGEDVGTELCGCLGIPQVTMVKIASEQSNHGNQSSEGVPRADTSANGNECRTSCCPMLSQTGVY